MALDVCPSAREPDPFLPGLWCRPGSCGCRFRRRVGHPSTVQARCPSKNSRNRADDSSAITPVTTFGRCGSLGSRMTSKRELTAPAFESKAPKTTLGILAATMVPAHMVHGSKVTTRVQSPSASHHELPRHDGWPAPPRGPSGRRYAPVRCQPRKGLRRQRRESPRR